ncbi:tRNA-dihydrouridine synthase [Azovibrio restrictus]|uniref:tRNA dihydrouridine synthase n=1 Tax=Azovibrio restrictus TaxID=146938 RepID=UPI0026F2CEEA|nr:tRNA-dihydrouridine synthase [Azovibrio restrictus]
MASDSAAQLVLAPMEGLADHEMREVLTAVGGYDWGICQFVRVSGSVLPRRTFQRICPELLQGGRTRAGTPIRVQLMGSDPGFLADNASTLVELAPAGIDLNFGCPAPTVNRHRGGAALLEEPELLHEIASAVRARVPVHIPFTAKMRLGLKDTSRALECARALEAGGVDALIVHGRTKVDGYRPPARWGWIARVREAVRVPVVANGEVWTEADYAAIRAESGCRHVMLGRGAVADPLLPRRIRGEATGGWPELRPHLADYWVQVCRRVLPEHAPGRLKQWLGLMRRAYPEAEQLYTALRPVRGVAEVDALLRAAGIPVPHLEKEAA